MKTITMKLNEQDIATFEKHKEFYGATRTSVIRMLAQVLRDPESTKAFLDLAADCRKEA